jgi:putative ABC transport system permease protein
MWTRLLALFSRVRFALERRRLDEEATRELESHLDLLTADYVGRGLPPDEARLAARRQVGNLTQVREEIYRMNSISWLDALAQDIRYAIRTFGRDPGLAAVVVATLALGVGANAAIFSVAYSVLLKPLPYSHPDQIYSVEVILPERRDQIPSLPATVQAYLRWREPPTGFTAFSALTPWECSLTGDGEPERLGGAQVSASFFSFLGVPLARGREFSADEEQPGNEHVVVISDTLWRRRYAADPGVIGKSIAINGDSHTIIGIAPPSLLMPTGTLLHPLLPFAPRIDIWKPIAPTNRELKNESWDYGVLMRLQDGGSPRAAEQQLAAALNEMIRAQMPGLKTEALIRLVPIREIFAAGVRLRLLLVLAASALLLLTACASIANVLLARVASRSGEFATRIALGAGRARILSQTLTETLVVAIAGGACGAVVATYGVNLIASSGPDQLRLLADTRVNLPFLLFAATASLATGVCCGVVAAWQAFRRDAGAELKEGARSTVSHRRAGRSRQVLISIEMAIATVLLGSAGLLLRSFVNVMHTDRGYDVERVLAIDISLFGQRYSAGEDRVAFYRGLLENVRAVPGVLAAGAVNNLPAVAASEGPSRTIFHPTDTNFRALVLARPVAMIRSVTAGYFTASGSPLRAGRVLTDEERGPIAVISESLGSRLWPRETPAAIVGRQLRQGDVVGPLIRVVGVVADAQPGGVDRVPLPAVYRPYEQWASGPMTLVIRTAAAPSALARAIRAEIHRMDPNLPVASIRTMREIVSSEVAERRFQMTLTALFAVVALLLGAVGIYGVVSYSVACRTRDLGLRIALGAVKADIMRSVFARGMRPVVVGLAIGLPATIAVARAFRGLLFGLVPSDPLSLASVVVVLLFASGLACYVPARRAAGLDPILALRHE